MVVAVDVETTSISYLFLSPEPIIKIALSFLGLDTVKAIEPVAATPEALSATIIALRGDSLFISLKALIAK